MRRSRFRKHVVDASGGCAIQHTGWPCGSCFFEGMRADGVSNRRAGHWWHAVLIYRGDYGAYVKDDVARLCSSLRKYPSGKVGHRWVKIPMSEIRRRIAEMAAFFERRQP